MKDFFNSRGLVGRVGASFISSASSVFQLGELYDHLSGKELFIRFTLRIFRELLSV